MAIFPIDTGRYGTPEMRRIFEAEARLQRLLDVEAALAWAQGQVGEIPKEDVAEIVQRASTKYVRLSRVMEIEAEVKHDLMAMVKALAEACGPSGACVHLGAASSDILDTATALQLKEAIEIIHKRLSILEETLMTLAKENRSVVMAGRTHGQHALPITLGFKFAVWLREVSRHIKRLDECSERVLVGKMSGAVGTQAGFGSEALKIQKLVMDRLGLKPVEISTQIIQRDRYAELICLFSIIASSLDKFATEIRELQRPEIGELAEPFEVERQIGSSTMPHKRNPILCERICGLAKVVRGLVPPALENVITWHERDLTQSSCERFIIPEACILVDYMLLTMIDVLSGLQIDRERMRGNIDLSQGRIMSEAVMLALARKGMSRQEAHDLVRRLSLLSEARQRPLKEILAENETIKGLLSIKEIDEVLVPDRYLGTAFEQIERVIELTEAERRRRRRA